MRRILKSVVFCLAAMFAASAQQSEPRATGNMWLDMTAGKNGAVIYPQYNWSIATATGTFRGYGFVESAPYERLFSNNLVNFTPNAAKWFTVHGEVGGLPGYAKGFVQLGPRANVVNIVPQLDKIAAYVFVAYLPAFEGIRTRNVLFAGQSDEFPLTGPVTLHVEAFDRVFSNFSYGEVWLVSTVKNWEHVHPIVHMIRDSSREPTRPEYTVSFGIRISFK